MRKFALLATLLFAACFVQAQSGVLSGQISDPSGPLPAASVSVPGVKGASTTTDLQGKFTLSVPAGTYTVQISFVGYKTEQRTADVKNGLLTNMGTILLSENTSLDQLVVRSTYAQGERKALSMRKNATAIMDVVSADGVGKLPDRNAAEAVQRMPGVSIDRDQGEGRYVTVRGTPSQWSATTVNGDRLPAAKTSGDLLGNRTVPLDILPSEFIQYVQVVKAITPNYEGDAIGGTINFVTRTSPEKRIFSVTAATTYQEKAERFGFNGTIVYGDRFLKNKLGLMLLATVNKRPYETNSFEVIYGNALHNVNTLDVRHYHGDRTTDGYNAAIDYQLSPGVKLFARGYYTSLLDNERNRKTMYYFEKTTANEVLRWSAVDYWFKNYGGETGLSAKLSNQLSMDGKFALYESWAGYKGPSSVNKDRRGYYYGNWIQTGKFDNLTTVNGKPYKFLKGDEPDASYTGDDAYNIQPHFNAATPFNADNFYLDRYVISIRNIKETDRVGSVDFKYQVASNIAVKFGSKYRYKTSSYDYRYITWIYKTTAPKTYLTAYEREPFPHSSNYFPEINHAYDNLMFAYPTLNSFIDPMANSTIAPNLTYTENNATNSQYATGNYKATEKVWAGYAMTEWNINNQLTLVPGVRYEATSVNTNSFAYNEITKVATPISGGKNYPAFLPMAHAIYKPTNSMDIRAAVTRTFSRPAFNELSAYTSLNETALTIKKGNPQLKPTYAWNYDLIASYYMDNSSYLSGGLFYKDIKDVILVNSTQISQSGNTYQVTQPGNSDKAFLYGMELIYSQKFTMLPGFLKGLGLNLNYTYTKSETGLEAREGEKVGLLNQSPHIFNAALLYEKYGFAVRLAANYRAAFLVEVRDNKMADRYQDNDLQMDLNITYNFPKNISLFADANNLTNQALRYYHGVKGRPEQVEYYGLRGRIGISWKL
jgi:TonB-dependent receptor